MAKHTMEFEASGGAPAFLSRLESQLGRVAKKAKELDSDGGGGGGGGAALKALAGQGLEAAGNKLDEMADRVFSAVSRVTDAGKAMFNGIVADASKFEDSQSDMKFAFGDGWENVFGKVKAEAKNLTMTFDEVSGLASALGRMKINPFGTTGDDLAVFKGKSGQALSALQILQDTSNATGRNQEEIMFSLRNALAGQMMSMKQAVDMPTEKFDKMSKAIKAAKGEQEKYNVLIQSLGDYFGGAGAGKAKNWSMAMQQIPDLLQQLKAAVGAGGLTILTDSMWNLIARMSDFVGSEDAVQSLGGAFTMVATAVAWLIDRAADAVTFVRMLLETAPWFPILAVGIVLVGVVMGTIVGVALSLGAALAFVVAMFVMIGFKAALAGAVIAIAFFPVFALMTAALGILGLTAFAVFSNMGAGAGGAIGVFDKIRRVWEGLSELFSSYNGETGRMSKATEASLKEAGLLGFVDEVFDVYHRVRSFLKGFWNEISNMGDTLAPEIRVMFEELKAAGSEFMDMLGLTPGKMDEASGSSSKWADAGKALAQVFVQVVRWVILAVTAGVQLYRAGQAMGLWKVLGFGVLIVLARIVGTLFLVGAAAWAMAQPFIYAFKLVMKMAYALGLVKKETAEIMKFKIGVEKDGVAKKKALEAQRVADEKARGLTFDMFPKKGTQKKGVGAAADGIPDDTRASLEEIGLLPKEAAPVAPRPGADPGGLAKASTSGVTGGGGKDQASGAETAKAIAMNMLGFNSIVAAIQALDLTVNLDGEKIASAVAGAGARAGGNDG